MVLFLKVVIFILILFVGILVINIIKNKDETRPNLFEELLENRMMKILFLLLIIFFVLNNIK